MSFEKQTYNLAKMLYNINIASEYADHIRNSKDVTFNGKATVNRIHQKLIGAINEIKLRLPEASYKILQREMTSDVFVFESITDKLVQLDEKERWEVEEYINKKIKSKLQ